MPKRFSLLIDITNEDIMKKKIKPIHPGEILFDEFMVPLNLSQNKLGRDLDVSPRRINEIVLGKRNLTADTALRLAHYFKMSTQFWLGLQMEYDLALEEDHLANSLEKKVKIFKEQKAA